MTETADSKVDVAIAGGSFVGLALALALARSAPAGFRVVVIDAAPPQAAPADARASALTAASRRLLEVLDVWPALASEAQPIRHIDITDSALNTPIRPLVLHFETELEPGEPAAHMVENAHLRAALMAAVDRVQGIRLLAPRRVESFSAGEAGVTAVLDDGTRLEAGLLVAADGRNSTLRKQAGIRTIGWSYAQSGIVTTVAHERPHDGHAVQHFLPAGPFAILPLTGNRASLVWTEERERAQALIALDDDAFLQELTRRFGHRLGRLTLAGPRAAYPLAMHVARRFIAERLALVGDAAHGVHPLAGQGLNIGLRDVAALTEVAVEAARLGLDIGSEPVLERYEGWRRFDSAFSAAAMDGLNRLFSNNSAPLRSLRTFGLGVVDRVPSLKRFFVQEAAGITGAPPRLLKGEPV